MELQNKIAKLIEEHQSVVDHLTKDMEKLRLEMVELHKDSSKKKELVMASLSRITLEMKEKFHLGAIAALKDLQDNK